MPMPEYDPFGRRPDLAPKFTGAPTHRLPYQKVEFLGGEFDLTCPDDCSLTSREFDLMTRASFGYSNPMIARKLGLARQTVHNQMSRLLTKIDVDGRSELLSAAFYLGYIAIATAGEPPEQRPVYAPHERFPVTIYNLEIIRRIGSGLTHAEIGEEFGRSDKTIQAVLDNMKDSVGFSGADTYFAAAVATGQVHPVTCRLMPVDTFAAQAQAA